MASGVQKFNPLGGLDQDTDPNYVREGNYSDALNVRHLTDNTESTQSIVPIKGNELAFTIPAITTTQNKKYRVFHEAGAATARIVTLYRTDGTTLCTFGYNDGAALANTVANFAAEVNAEIALASPVQTVTLAAAGDNTYTDFTLTTVTGYEYTLVSTGGNTVEIECRQEAYDVSLLGEMNVISSFDLLGDLFVLSTPCTTLPSESVLNATAASSGGLIRVTTSTPHLLESGRSYRIMTDIGTVPTMGIWIVDVISSTQFDLENSVFSGASAATDITIVSDHASIGEIGVGVFDNDMQTWSYTRLLRSKEFNFTTKKQADMQGEMNSQKKSVYWADDYNFPRAFYYKGSYTADGGITSINSEGLYAYDSINEETNLFINNSSARITITGQAQAGGAVKSGNWRYAFRFLTDSLVSTDLSELTNPISVFPESTSGNPRLIGGAPGDYTTSKVNQLSLTGIVPGVFKYVELIGINYVESAIVGYVISRTELDGFSTSININHTGNETYTDFDLGELSVNSQKYLTAKNIRIIDNRMVLSNLTARQIEDFSDWAAQFTHELKLSSITGVREVTQGTYQLGEYLVPINVHDKVGYMHQETYRFGVRGRFKDTGELSPVFWVDDINFTTSATNITTPDRRIAGLPSYNLTPAGTASTAYVPYVEFSNIDLDYLIDGIPVRDYFSEIIFERAECIPEVLAAGCVALSCDDPIYGAGANDIGEYPYISGDLATVSGATPVYPGGLAAAVRTVAKMYSPDLFCQRSELSYVSGDIIYNYGNPSAQNPSPANVYQNLGVTYYSSMHEYNGYIGAGSPVTNIVNAVTYFASGSAPTVFGAFNYSNQVLDYFGGGGPNTHQWNSKAGYTIGVTANIAHSGVNTDYGFYYAQYFRAITYTDPDDNKYGRRALTAYVPTGAYYTIDGDSPAVVNGIVVFGGDTFTQKFYLKHRAMLNSTMGGGGGVGFYCQSKVNAQMIDNTSSATSTAWLFPETDITEWVEDTDFGAESAPYNRGYDINDDAQVFAAYDSSAEQQTDFSTRIIYSDLKLAGGTIDSYRSFLPLNFKDLDLSFGEIVHHDNYNGELITWQQRKLQRQYFNTRGELDSTGLGILIGDGSVLSRDGQTMSSIGTKHKWSVIKGKSVQGNDTFYWINTELKKAIRLGFDGTVSMADIKGMQSFFANNLTWVENKDTPADGEGICGFWDDRNAEVGWTVRGEILRPDLDWNIATAYLIGDVVYYNTPNFFSTFYETGEFYQANADNTGVNPGTGDRAEATLDINIIANGNEGASVNFDTTMVGDLAADSITADDGVSPVVVVDGLNLSLAGLDQPAVDAALAGATIEPGWTVIATFVAGAVIDWSIVAPAASQTTYDGFDILLSGVNWTSTPGTPTMSGGVDATQSIRLMNGVTEVLEIIPSSFEWICDWDGNAVIDAADLIDFQNALDAVIATGFEVTVNTYTGTIGNVITNVTFLAPQSVGSTYNGFTVEEGSGTAFSITPEPFAGGTDTGPWTVIPHTNNNYYNEYTIIFNEFKNKFTTFASFKPKIYLKWKDTYLSPRPISNVGKVYRHNKGNYCSWYDAGVEENGYLEGVINEYPDEVKWATAMRVQSDVVPYRAEFTTYSQESFLTESEFESRERYHDSPIKEDSTGTGVNDGDTSLLYGNWLKVKIFFETLTYQKLYNFIVKFRISARNSGK